MKMFDTLFNFFFPVPSPEVMAVQQLEEARRELLKARAEREYVTAIEGMYEERVARLTETVGSIT